MSAALIRKAFETRLKTWAAAQVPPIPVAYENVPFVAPSQGAAGFGRYARAYMLAGQTVNSFLDGTHREYVGVYQVTLVLSLSRGPREAADLSLALDMAFPVGKPLSTEGGVGVWVVKPFSMGPALENPDNYVIPVSANYQAQTVLSPVS